MAEKLQKLWKIDVYHVHIIQFLNVTSEKQPQVNFLQYEWYGLGEQTVEQRVQLDDASDLLYTVYCINGACSEQIDYANVQLNALIFIINSVVKLSTRENILLPGLKYHDFSHYLLGSLYFHAHILLSHVELVSEDWVRNHLSKY